MRGTIHIRYVQDREFTMTLRRRAAAYFATATWPRAGDRPLQVHAVAVSGLWWVGYVALLLGASSPWVALPAFVALVLLSPAVTIAGHAVAHRMLDGAPLARMAAKYTTIALGFGGTWWVRKHNHLHHAYTNVFGLDDDLDQGGILRLSRQAPLRPHHQFQWLYAWPVYLTLHVAMIFAGEARYIIMGRIGRHVFPRLQKRDLAIWLLHKGLAASVLVAIPATIHPVGAVIVVLCLWSAAFSLLLSIIFQTSHCVGAAKYPRPDPTTGIIAADWHVAQIAGTADVAPQSRIYTWLYGGLNLHVAHHLFPNVSPTHYRALTAIVQGLCGERGISYRSYSTLRSALVAHVEFLRVLGGAGETKSGKLPVARSASTARAEGTG